MVKHFYILHRTVLNIYIFDIVFFAMYILHGTVLNIYFWYSIFGLLWQVFLIVFFDMYMF